MCGLVAEITLANNGFSVEEMSMFEHAMVFNQMRGDDSTGVVCVTNDNDWTYVKSVGGWKDFTRGVNWANLRSKILNNGRLVFGHGRAATRGNVNTDNAHPFHLLKNPADKAGESIIFMHNGTLEWDQDLPGLLAHDVDSKWLGQMILTHGAVEAISSVRGAIACMWWDTEKLTFNFYRNTERPLYWMSNKKGQFWLNSEKAILEYMNLKFKLGISEKNIYMVKDGLLCTTTANGDHFAEIQHTEIKPKPKKIVPSYLSHYMDDTYSIETSYGGYNSPIITPPPEDKEFWDREIETKEWRNGEEIITYRNRTVVKMIGNPPEENLLRMFEAKDSGNVTKVFLTTGGALKYVTVSFAEWKANKEKELPVVSKKNTTIRFTTRMAPNNVKVKHRGQILVKTQTNSLGYPYLSTYMNSVDGSVSVGDKVYMEVIAVEDRENAQVPGLVKVIGARIKPKQDMYVDCQFFSSILTKEEILKHRFFEGTVSSIKLKSREEIKQDIDFGSVVICSLSQPKPMNGNILEDAVVEAESSNEKTVY